jgi:hypothetical protein
MCFSRQQKRRSKKPDPDMNEERSKISSDPHGKVLFYSDRQTVLWFVVLISLILPAVCVFLVNLLDAGRLADEFGTVTKGRIFQIALVVFSGLFLYVMIWYSGRYVLKVVQTPTATIRITVWSLFAGSYTKEYHPVDFQSGHALHTGRTYLPGVPIVNAPYTGLRLKTGKKFIIDAQGTYPFGEAKFEEIFTT